MCAVLSFVGKKNITKGYNRAAIKCGMFKVLSASGFDLRLYKNKTKPKIIFAEYQFEEKSS